MNNTAQGAVSTESLSERVERLEKALRPFALLIDNYEKLDGPVSWIEFISDYAWPIEQECRDARAALTDSIEGK